MKKLILHIPHSSAYIPFFDGYVASNHIIENEILKLTDWYTDELFHSEIDDMIVANFSRVFCDTERFELDELEPMSKKGMGVLYETTDDGLKLRSINPTLRNRIITNFYFPHHLKLKRAVDYQLSNFGKAIIIDCHSLSNIPFKRDDDQDTLRSDFSIGTDNFHTPFELEDLTKKYFKNFCGHVDVNKPYNGTLVPSEYYKKNKNVYSIMIEINRNLYLKENSNLKNENFVKTKQIITNYLNKVRDIL